MKRSLLLINAIFFCAFAGSCQSSPKTVTSGEAKPTSTVAPSSSNSQPVSSTSVNQGSTNTIGIKKDTATKSTPKGKAIIHSAPEQAKIDSLKKAKSKGKHRKK